VDDLILFASIHVKTAWNGLTPTADFGPFASTAVGWMTNGEWGFGNAYAMTSALASADLSADMSFLVPPTGRGGTMDVQSFCVVKAAEPVKIVVSQDGTNVPTAATLLADSPATVPSTIVAATNDQFQFTDPIYGTLTYTVAPGVLANIAAMQAAMLAATAAGPGTFGAVASLTNDGTTFTATAKPSGAAGNADVFAEGNGFLALSGFGTEQFAGGAGGDPGSTQGEAILYLVTATPYTD
jgi:hypothetical protein